MRDTTVRRASRQGAGTLPVEHGRPRTPKPGHEPISPTQRTEEAIIEYARKRTA